MNAKNAQNKYLFIIIIFFYQRILYMDKLLSSTDIKRIIGDCKIITYDKIKQYSSIEQLFGNLNKVVLLYVNETEGNDIIGHWCLLLRKKNLIEFWDSFGKSPDAHLKSLPSGIKIMFNQNYNYLLKLLYDFSIKKNHEVHYNEFKMQNNNTNTCGRFVAVRGYFAEIDMNDYQKIFKNLKKKGYDLDEVIVYLSDHLNGKEI